MSGPWRKPSPLGLLIPAGLLAALAVATACKAPQAEAPQAEAPPSPPAVDPQGAVLAACRLEGAAAPADPVCEAAWAAARRRFLGGAR